MLSKQILNAALPSLSGRTITDVVIGISLIAVELDGTDVGVAYTLRDGLPSGCGAFAFAQKIIGTDAAKIASLSLTGTDDIQRGVAAAVLNAASHTLDLIDTDTPEKPFGVEPNSNDTLAIIGYMAPIARRFESRVGRTIIFDRGRELAGMKDVESTTRQAELLPACDIVIASGTTVTNQTVDQLLELCTNSREFILTGTSTPLFPEGYADTKVTALGGSWWDGSHKEELFKRIAHAGGISNIREFMNKKSVRI